MHVYLKLIRRQGCILYIWLTRYLEGKKNLHFVEGASQAKEVIIRQQYNTKARQKMIPQFGAKYFWKTYL